MRESGANSSIGVVKGLFAPYRATVQHIAEFFLHQHKEMRLLVLAFKGCKTALMNHVLSPTVMEILLKESSAEC